MEGEPEGDENTDQPDPYINEPDKHQIGMEDYDDKVKRRIEGAILTEKKRQRRLESIKKYRGFNSRIKSK